MPAPTATTLDLLATARKAGVAVHGLEHSHEAYEITAGVVLTRTLNHVREDAKALVAKIDLVVEIPFTAEAEIMSESAHVAARRELETLRDRLDDLLGDR
jgi:hypothetical protein